MSRYLLSAHSYVCVADEHAVFLDLKRDKYTAVEPDDVRVLSSLVRGGPASAEPDNTAVTAPIESDAAITRMLLDEGLLTESATAGKEATPVALTPVTTTIDDVRGSFPRMDFRDFANFVAAWISITVTLRCFSLNYHVRRVKKRKRRMQRAEHAFDIEQAHRL